MSIFGGYTLLFMGMPSMKLGSPNHRLQTLFPSSLIGKCKLMKVYPSRIEQETEFNSDGLRDFN